MSPTCLPHVSRFLFLLSLFLFSRFFLTVNKQNKKSFCSIIPPCNNLFNTESQEGRETPRLVSPFFILSLFLRKSILECFVLMVASDFMFITTFFFNFLPKKIKTKQKICSHRLTPRHSPIPQTTQSNYSHGGAPLPPSIPQ